MGSKPNLFFDFDGFKFDTIPATVAYINHRYGINSIATDYINAPPLEQILNKYLPSDRQTTRIEAYTDISKNFLSSEEWHENVLPFEGMCEIVPLLAEKYTLWTVTARQKRGLAVIERLIEKYISGCIAGVHCVWGNLKDGSFHEVTKKEFIESVPGEKLGFFDDSPKEILAVHNILPCYLFDPFRVHDHEFPEIQNRVRNWEEIGEIFL